MFGVPYQYTESRILKVSSPPLPRPRSGSRFRLTHHPLGLTLQARLEFLRDSHRIKESDYLTFDAMRHAAQCVGRVLRGKTDWGLMVFADQVGLPLLCTLSASGICLSILTCLLVSSQRFARADKRAKLPKWINQYITESHSKLSTDMAIALSRHFIRSISQPYDHSITGISVWSLEQLEAKQDQERVRRLFFRPPFHLARYKADLSCSRLRLADRSGTSGPLPLLA